MSSTLLSTHIMVENFDYHDIPSEYLNSVETNENKKTENIQQQKNENQINISYNNENLTHASQLDTIQVQHTVQKEKSIETKNQLLFVQTRNLRYRKRSLSLDLPSPVINSINANISLNKLPNIKSNKLVNEFSSRSQNQQECRTPIPTLLKKNIFRKENFVKIEKSLNINRNHLVTTSNTNTNIKSAHSNSLFWYGKEDPSHVEIIIKYYSEKLIKKHSPKSRAPINYIGKVKRIIVEVSEKIISFDEIEIYLQDDYPVGKQFKKLQIIFTLTEWNSDGIPILENMHRVIDLKQIEHILSNINNPHQKDVSFLYCLPYFRNEKQFAYISTSSNLFMTYEGQYHQLLCSENSLKQFYVKKNRTNKKDCDDKSVSDVSKIVTHHPKCLLLSNSQNKCFCNNFLIDYDSYTSNNFQKFLTEDIPQYEEEEEDEYKELDLFETNQNDTNQNSETETDTIQLLHVLIGPNTPIDMRQNWDSHFFNEVNSYEDDSSSDEESDDSDSDDEDSDEE